MVKYLVNQGVDPLIMDSLNQTVLFYACRDGKPQLVHYFLELGCDANHIDSNH